MTDPQLPALRPETLPTVALPPPPAHVARFAEAIGPELTMKLLLALGGGELGISDRPGARSRLVQIIGPDAARRLAARAHLLPRRIPLGNEWLARCLAAQGTPTAEIARTLRASDVAVRGWLKPGPRRG